MQMICRRRVFMTTSSIQKRDDISIVLCGEAGQGIQTVEQILTRMLKLSGFNIFGTKEYMSRVRGGSNSTQIRVSSRNVSSAVDRIDILIPLDQKALQHVGKRLSPGTIILGGKEELVGENDNGKLTIIDIPFSQIASDIGGRVYSNTVATGVIAGLFKVDRDDFLNYVTTFFSEEKENIIEKNREAAKKGYEIAQDLIDSGAVDINVKKDPGAAQDILISGAEAIGIGAIAGGCNFISSYPMSPSTAVLVFLSRHGEEFDIVTEQAEDEISAINMALGAWYAGARAMVTTSGGGFALMEESVGLAGMLESPVVIHLAQRPGPATGLPTRTEQGDLQLALYSGHGEFPRIIFAPGKLEDAVSLSSMAFDLADKYQIPVFILTDQYFMDSYYNMPSLPLSDTRVAKYIVKTDKRYQRYALTKNGISPRGVPGFGSGLVSVDSDEHDEEGHITEDLDLRVKMVKKRLAKLKEIEKDALPPELVGRDDYTTLIVGWGSTYHTIKEALGYLKRDDVSFLHFKQVFPLHRKTPGYLKKATKVVMIEGNATAQFSHLINRQTGFTIQDKILKYSGLQFSVEEIVEQLEQLL
jgi:2-oxoglutarate ferredoxin oxidoreductase subunit alpha